jgi:alkyldihydroxyacetonephosphate synthase
VLSDREVDALAATVATRFALEGRRRVPPTVESLNLPAPRAVVPRALESIAAADPFERASHSYGKSYRDVVRALYGQLDHPPDVVVRPRSGEEVASVLDWCGSATLAVIPYGGGSSVVGGVEPAIGDGYAGSVTLDLEALDEVLEVDPTSMAARIQAGATGPSLEEQLRVHGLTLRHFPQSFECSTLGGWIATRSGGHFATGPTHIDELVESLKIVTPRGVVETRRLPASGAGPSPDRLFVGSEGVLGVVTEAWMRVRPRPRWRAGGPARFSTFQTGASAVRALAQSGLEPSNCRLIDPLEALVNGAGDGASAVLLVGFESADHPLEAWSRRAQECVLDHGALTDPDEWHHTEVAATAPGRTSARDGDPAAAWRRSFTRAPYLRDALVTLGVLCETFETAVTWDRFESLHASVTSAVCDALREEGADAGVVTCRLTHAYPDGVAPYFTVLAPARPQGELEQWAAIKAAASEAILAAGGTVTHHHAVGRDHRRWYDRQRPALFAESLQAAKAALDPAGILNPGVLIDPAR